MANALAHGDGAPPDSYQSTLQTKNEQIERLESRLAELESKVGDAESTVAADEAPVDSTTETGEESTADEESAPAVDSPEGDDTEGDSAFVFDETADEEGGRDALVEAVQDRLRRRGERLQLQDGAGEDQPAPEAVVDLLQAPPVVIRVNASRRESKCNDDAAWDIVSDLATNPGASAHDLADAADVDVEAAHTLLSELRARDLVVRENHEYAFNAETMRTLVERDDPTKPRTELRDQWKP